MAGHGANGRADGGVPIAEAARLLGTAPEALRKRLGRGTLQGEKREGAWYIHLPDQEDDGMPCPDACPDSRDAAGATHPEPINLAGRTERTDPDAASRLAVAEARLAEVERQRDFLESELGRRGDDLAAALERLREAHLLLAQRPALPAPVPAPPSAPVEGQEAPSRPWWAFWRREESRPASP